MAVGAYAISLQEREQLRKANPKTAGAVCLKLLGERPQSFRDLLSVTGLPESYLQESLAELRRNGLIEGDDNEFRLTDRGEKARFLVAS